MSQEIRINDTLSIDYGQLHSGPFVAIQRIDGGRVVLDVGEVRGLIDALSEAAARAAADAAGDDFTEVDDLW